MIFTLSSLSQDLSKHQWKNRVLLIYTDDKNADDFKNQIKILSEHKKELTERKLVVYQFSENQYKTDFNTVWFLSNFKKASEEFKVILIGLDGDVKLKQKTILTTEKLFAIIDGMPIRKNELKSKNY